MKLHVFLWEPVRDKNVLLSRICSTCPSQNISRVRRSSFAFTYYTNREHATPLWFLASWDSCLVCDQEISLPPQSWSGTEPRLHIKMVPRPGSRWSFELTTWTALQLYHEVPVHALEFGRVFFTWFIRFGVRMWTFSSYLSVKRLWFKQPALLFDRGCNQAVSDFFLSFVILHRRVRFVWFDL